MVKSKNLKHQIVNLTQKNKELEKEAVALKDHLTKTYQEL